MIEKLELDGQTLYLKDGLNHRPNGPASYYTDNYWFWYLNGIPHRYYGPATAHGRKGIDPQQLEIWRIHGETIHLK